MGGKAGRATATIGEEEEEEAPQPCADTPLSAKPETSRCCKDST